MSSTTASGGAPCLRPARRGTTRSCSSTRCPGASHRGRHRRSSRSRRTSGTAVRRRTGWTPVAVLASLGRSAARLPPTLRRRLPARGRRRGHRAVAAGRGRRAARRSPPGRRPCCASGSATHAGVARSGGLTCASASPARWSSSSRATAASSPWSTSPAPARRSTSACSRTEPSRPGDWVLIHMGFAVERIDEATEADEAMAGPGADGPSRAGTPELPRGEPGVSAQPRAAGRFEVAGVVQGVGFRPFVYVTAPALGADRLGRQRPATASSSRSRATGGASRAFARRLRADAAAAGASSSRSTRRAAADGGTGFTHRRAPAPSRRRPHPRLARRRDLRRLPARAGRPGRPPLPAPVHHLHQLRPALHDHHRLPYDRPATTMAGFPMCAACAARVRRPGRPPLPRPADRLPRLRAPLRAGRRRRRDATRGEDAARRGARAARRRARSSRSRASAATTWPATPPTRRPSPSCARASSAATSRSR